MSDLIAQLQKLRDVAVRAGQDDIVKQIDAEIAKASKKRKG